MWEKTVYVDCAENIGFCSKINRARTLSFLNKEEYTNMYQEGICMYIGSIDNGGFTGVLPPAFFIMGSVLVSS